MLSSIVWWTFYLLNIFPERYHAKKYNEFYSDSAIVVLTGGKGRFEKGFSLLRQKLSNKLFVSGVFPGVNLKKKSSLNTNDDKLFECCVYFDHKAVNTKENAEEVKKWLDKNAINNFYLVSSYYHLPRVKILFERKMPNKIIKLVAVEENLLDPKEIIDYIFNFKLIITEYFKILFIVIFK
tara:strand:- start:371 stop:913 length:543 start_codon:yes stop_codon:yes gene_type:complete